MSPLSVLYPNATEGYIAVTTLDPPYTRFFPVQELSNAEAYMLQAAEIKSVYYSWCLQEHDLGSSRRGNADTTIAIPGLLADIDFVGEAHAKSNLPKDLNEFRNWYAETGLPQPTAIINSGNGIYCWWLFDTPVHFNTPEERKRFRNLSSAWQKQLIQRAAKDKGWSLDNVGDLARITRMPGTKNHKSDPPKPVEFIELDDTRRYRPEELETIVRNAIEAKKPVSSRKVGRPRNPRVDQPNDLPSWETITAGCDWAKSVEDRASHLPEEEWYAFAGIVGRCANSEEIFHELSAVDERYDRDEAANKLAHAVSAAGPRLCDTIAESFGSDHCLNCPFLGNCTSPITLGRANHDEVELMRNNIYVVGLKRWIDLNTGVILDDTSFSGKYRHLTRGKAATGVLLCNKLTRKVDIADYIPGEERLFLTNDAGASVYNLWSPGQLCASNGSCDLILGQFALLFPDAVVRNHILDVLACAVQQPSVKIRHMILIIGEEGTGKSFLLDLIEILFGASNVRRVHGNDALNSFNAVMGNVQVLGIDELQTFERREANNSLKLWLSQETVLANQKFMPQHLMRTPRFIIGFTNYDRPISLEGEARRYLVYKSPAKKRDRAYYDRLFTEGLSQAGAFLNYLQQRDISSFSPDAPPPETEAKSDLIRASRSQLVQEIDQLMQAEALPFHCDLFTLADVQRELQISMGKSFSPVQVSEALRQLGAENVGQVTIGGGKGIRARLWAWRNQERWSQASQDEMRREWQPTSPAETMTHRLNHSP